MPEANTVETTTKTNESVNVCAAKAWNVCTAETWPISVESRVRSESTDANQVCTDVVSWHNVNSYWHKAVGYTFNPSGDLSVTAIKTLTAKAIDFLNDLRSSTESSEVKRLCSVAITEFQTAQMWWVKAVTWKD